MRAGEGARGELKRFAIKTLKLCAFGGIFGALFWYATKTVGDLGNADRLIIGLTIFGVTYGISKPLFDGITELVGGIMVLAEFLNRHLLEPQKQRLLEEGRAKERAEIRAHLEELGLDPDEILPAPNCQDPDDQS